MLWRAPFIALLWAAITSPATAATPASAEAAYRDELVARARALRLSEQKQWLKLGHYVKGIFGGMESQADGLSFFLSPQGKDDPAAELDATLAGFFSREPLQPKAQHPRCQFPARFLWLKEKLGIDDGRLPPADCSRFIHFRDSMAARSATVVFSSYYLNNPSSAFGHSFLRLNKSGRSEPGRAELLDYGINYAAVMDTSNMAIYAIKGIFGLFQGTFTSVPYYYKVREYNDFEARDLWEYDVRLTPRQLELLVAHIWELGSTWFRYYYFTENCSYHILTMLEAANPELTLTSRQNYIVIPADTIRVINTEPGLVSGIHFRPSIRAQFRERLSHLDPEQLDALEKLTSSKSPRDIPASLSPPRRVQVLDAGADYIDFRYSKDVLDKDSQAAKWKQEFLIARAELAVPSEELKVPTPWNEGPHAGHGSRRAGIEGGASSDLGPTLMASYRFSLHDLADPWRGYPELSQIEMFSTRFRYNLREGSRSFWLDEADLFRIVSLTPLERFNMKSSWRVNAGVERIFDRSCMYCVGPRIEFGTGFAVQPLPALSFWAFAESDGVASPHLQGSHFALGAGPGAGTRLRLGERGALLVSGHYHYQFFLDEHDSWQGIGQLRWEAFPGVALNLRGAAYPREREASLGVYLYH
jgi:hypothetical protein